MFSYEQLEKYNETDVAIYRYIVKNLDKVAYMSIRELAHDCMYRLPRFCDSVSKMALPVIGILSRH
ncbi:hypothetical protein S101258_00398 [Lactiplantibacillus plantarum subsp. plantarum]|uniref:Uncharacterized protein n=1 Tax=Lactiplantibacillus plantarum subsp. plantarum TaxID=337330 RepID=A0A2S3U980_LACPN|nr:hypothetical protein S101258_00398 [Lactiplantibacillus plantarum subsp. plantarum]